VVAEVGGGLGVGAAGDEKIDGGELLGREWLGVGCEELAGIEIRVRARGFGDLRDGVLKR
jgi:hypothetical protein